MASQITNSTRKAGIWLLLKQAFVEMKKNDPMRMAGATAFFTSFALPPILIILFQLFTLFLSGRVVGSEMMEILAGTFGSGSANQIRATTRGFRNIAQNWYVAAGGFIFLLFVATTLFTVIKNSLNDIWEIKIREKAGILFYLKLRARSLLVILAAGLLFLASILIDSFELVAGGYMDAIFEGKGRFFTGVLNESTGVAIVTIWFIVLFRYLADGRPPWKVAIAGGILTGVFFSAGKAILSFLMRSSNINTIYGASGSLVLLLLLVFYFSFILYYGASFVKVYAAALQLPIKLQGKAFHYQLHKID